MFTGSTILEICLPHFGLFFFLLQEAIKNDSFHQPPDGSGQISRGDVKAGMESSEHVITGEMQVGGQEHFYMETHSIRVVPRGEDEEFDVYVGTQFQTLLQVCIDENRVKNSILSSILLIVISDMKCRFYFQGLISRALNVKANKVVIHTKRLGSI